MNFTLIALADNEMARGDLKKAEHYLAKARRMERKDPEVYLALARLAVRSGDIIAAGKYRTQARKLRESKK
jgi:Flp pilus assembly protein TadD